MRNFILLLNAVLYYYAKAATCDFSNTWVIRGAFNSSEIQQLTKSLGFKQLYKLCNDDFVLYKEDVRRSSKFKSDYHTTKLLDHPKVKTAHQEIWSQVTQRQVSTFTVNDPMWTKSWYMNDQSGQSMGILEAWKSGYTGKGISISIVDDGIDDTHPDLANKIDRLNSKDVYDNSRVIRPGPTFGHGTKCAGIAAAEKNNLCVIGSAYNATLVAIRMIGARGVLPSGRAIALQANVDISSNSWGGLDKTFSTMDDLATNALKYGVTKGRGGKGVIYVFAGGNGGFDDNCNMDGYVSSIYTISINGVTRDHTAPGYAEQCSAVLASAYTGSGGRKDNVCTTTKNNGCVEDFSGTSAATPLAAGALALVLQANPNLHWRDIQELIVRTSNLNALKYTNAKTNGAGRNVSHWFGYGLLDVQKMIAESLIWKSLPEQHTCIGGTRAQLVEIHRGDPIRIANSVIYTDGCNDTSVCVNNIEHVTVKVEFSYTFRGIVELRLKSPSGTVSELLSIRNDDTARNGRIRWTFMSVHFWGENPKGVWTLEMSVASQINEGGTIQNWMLTFYGTGSGCTRTTTSTTTTTTTTTTPKAPITETTPATPKAKSTQTTIQSKITTIHLQTKTSIQKIKVDHNGTYKHLSLTTVVVIAACCIVVTVIVATVVVGLLIPKGKCKNSIESVE